RGLVEAGQMYLSMGAALKATRFFQTAIDKGFATATAYVGLGRAHLLKQKQEEAVAAFTKAVEKDPLNGELWFELAQARTGPTQDDPEAVRLCRLALELDPDNAWLMTRIAMNEELWKQVQEPAKPGEAADGS
ncbi:MAG TPA: tetratricopeptide repeat protein, partial [Planctomycetota bacterium]|nr:tetratricopeptide repeat protein [Planctomycetota bacterium]